MPAHYLNYTFSDTQAFVDTFDELPLWSAPFGMLLLKHIKLEPNLTMLDIGSGAGFPLTEIAERLGSTAKCYGLDPWQSANDRAKRKVREYAIENVEVISGTAEEIPFGNDSVDLIISNLGINNFENPSKVLAECYRVLRPGGRIALTTNLNGHWKEFYEVFARTLAGIGKHELLPSLDAHCVHRGSVDSISQLFSEQQLYVTRSFEEQFEMNFLDGSAFLNHHFVKLGWLQSWKDLIPADDQSRFFESLEANLNDYAMRSNGLSLTVPMAYIEAQKA